MKEYLKQFGYTLMIYGVLIHIIVAIRMQQDVDLSWTHLWALCLGISLSVFFTDLVKEKKSVIKILSNPQMSALIAVTSFYSLIVNYTSFQMLMYACLMLVVISAMIGLYTSETVRKKVRR